MDIEFERRNSEQQEPPTFQTFIRATSRVRMHLFIIFFLELILIGPAVVILIFSPQLWLVAAILALIGIVLMLLVVKLVKELRLALELDRDGVTAAGVVANKWMTVDDSGTEETEIYHYVTYLFGDHTYLEDNQTAYQHLEIGSPVTVRYLPRDQDIARLEL